MCYLRRLKNLCAFRLTACPDMTGFEKEKNKPTVKLKIFLCNSQFCLVWTNYKTMTTFQEEMCQL
jgi:hypothetical protein